MGTQLVGLVRDKDGNVRFDDYANIPDIYHSILTEEDWIYIETKREELSHVSNS